MRQKQQPGPGEIDHWGNVGAGGAESLNKEEVWTEKY